LYTGHGVFGKTCPAAGYIDTANKKINLTVGFQQELKISVKLPGVREAVFPGGGGGTPIWSGRGCSSEILNLTPKRDQSGRGRSLCRSLKETSL